MAARDESNMRPARARGCVKTPPYPKVRVRGVSELDLSPVTTRTARPPRRPPGHQPYFGNRLGSSRIVRFETAKTRLGEDPWHHAAPTRREFKRAVPAIRRASGLAATAHPSKSRRWPTSPLTSPPRSERRPTMRMTRDALRPTPVLHVGSRSTSSRVGTTASSSQPSAKRPAAFRDRPCGIRSPPSWRTTSRSRATSCTRALERIEDDKPGNDSFSEHLRSLILGHTLKPRPRPFPAKPKIVSLFASDAL
jgi:hypothetical protein